jgi:hypothetical protein
MTLHRPGPTLNESQLLATVAHAEVFRLRERLETRRTELSMRRISRSVVGRAALILTSLAAMSLGLVSTDAVATPATTTTLPASIVAAGNVYARHLLSEQPIPAGARRVTALSTPLNVSGNVFPGPDVRHTQREYLLSSTVSVEAFVRGHVPRGEKVDGTGSSGGPNTTPVYSVSVSDTCVSAHVLYCGITYATTEAKNGQQELAVAVEVIYLPILHVKMPTDGVVTITGYGKTSLVYRSSEPTSVVLSHSQALAMTTAIAGLKDMGANLMCMEDSVLLRIKMVKNGRVAWRATADGCPGALTITSRTTNVILYNRSCSFWRVVDSFFPSGAAKATKTMTTSCAGSLYG